MHQNLSRPFQIGTHRQEEVAAVLAELTLERREVQRLRSGAHATEARCGWLRGSLSLATKLLQVVLDVRADADDVNVG